MVTSMWASMASWFTPAILFCVLNLGIGTIFVASKFKPRSHQRHHQLGGDNTPQLGREPSLLDRAISINLLHKYDQPGPSPSDSRNPDPQNDPPQPVQAPSLLERVKSVKFSSFKFETYDPSRPDTHYSDPGSDRNQASDHHVARSKSDRLGETPVKAQAKLKKSVRAQAKLKKSASASFADEHMEEEQTEEIDRRRPATVRVGEAASFGDDEGVDAKADDFISKFKQQLKLQRLDSLVRYNEMLGRGTRK